MLYATGLFYQYNDQQDSFSIELLTFSHDGRSIVSSTREGVICVWAAASLILGLLCGHQAAVGTVPFSPGDTWISSGSDDFTLCVWHAVSGIQHFILQGPKDIIISMVYSLDGLQIATPSRDQSIQIWNANAGDGKLAFHSHVDCVMALAFTPSSRQIVSSSWDMAIHILDIQSGAEFLVVQGLKYFALSVAYSLEGQTIISDHQSSINEWNAILLLSSSITSKLRDMQQHSCSCGGVGGSGGELDWVERPEKMYAALSSPRKKWEQSLVRGGVGCG